MFEWCKKYAYFLKVAAKRSVLNYKPHQSTSHILLDRLTKSKTVWCPSKNLIHQNERGTIGNILRIFHWKKDNSVFLTKHNLLLSAIYTPEVNLLHIPCIVFDVSPLSTHENKCLEKSRPLIARSRRLPVLQEALRTRKAFYKKVFYVFKQTFLKICMRSNCNAIAILYQKLLNCFPLFVIWYQFLEN